MGGGYRDRGYGGGDRYGGGSRDRYQDRYDDRRDDRDRYYERRGPPPPSYDRGYPDERRGGYDSYPPTNSYGKRPRPRSPSPYERDSRPRREYRSRSREYERKIIESKCICKANSLKIALTVGGI